MEVIAIFDIGKTNKKCFLFDQHFNQVHKEYAQFDEIKDEDGDPCDNLDEIVAWIRHTLDKLLSSEDFEVKAVNFSAYGASFVHLDAEGNPLTPLYNYLKPYPEEILKKFHDTYGLPLAIARETSSPALAMLNSGLQLYRLKYQKPEIFDQIRFSLHFPQYLSYLISEQSFTEHTSVGCHTALWDFEKQGYHRWVKEEGIVSLFPKMVATDHFVMTTYKGHPLKVGTGIHDSSAALLPYIQTNEEPFLLLSTGTWSIALNPFCEGSLSAEDLELDCLNFLSIHGESVRAARLFLGYEYTQQLVGLSEYYKMPEDEHTRVVFDPQLSDKLNENYARKFRFESINRRGKSNPMYTDYASFGSFTEAYHQLMLELVELQIEAIHSALAGQRVKKLYIDGGFADNGVFVALLMQAYPEIEIITTHSPLGSSLGAAMLVSDIEWQQHYFDKHFKKKEIKLEVE